MPDPAILPALRATIRENEIGAKSPYELEFAQKGQSGASFGFMQGDMHVQKDARDTMVAVLTAAGVAPPKITQLMTALTPALPKGNPLNAADAKLVNDALNSATGRPLVDAMDQRIFQGIEKGVDDCVAAAQQGGVTMTPLACLWIAPWINMSGPPSLVLKWLKGAAINGVPAPSPPTVDDEEVRAYLQSLAYFQQNPKNFHHYEQCVAVGAALLP